MKESKAFDYIIVGAGSAGCVLANRLSQGGEASPFHGLMRFDRIALAMIRAYVFGTGPGTVLPNCLFAFIKTKPDLAVRDIEFMFRAVSGEPYVWFPGIRPGFDDEIAIRPTLLHPKSRGEVQVDRSIRQAPHFQ